METAQITLHFVINYETQNGEDVYVLGNHPEFGNWSVEKGIKLVWSDVSYCLLKLANISIYAPLES